MKQDKVRTKRNDVYRNRLHSDMKQLMKAVKELKVAELPQMLTKTYKTIDTALKKKLIKGNNAARKKSRMARLVNEVMVGKKEEAPVA